MYDINELPTDPCPCTPEVEKINDSIESGVFGSIIIDNCCSFRINNVIENIYI